MSELTERARAREMLTGITPGPWEQNGINGVHTPDGSCVATTHQVAGRQRKADAEFIAAAPQLVADLLKELEAGGDEIAAKDVCLFVARRENARLTAALERVEKLADDLLTMPGFQTTHFWMERRIREALEGK